MRNSGRRLLALTATVLVAVAFPAASTATYLEPGYAGDPVERSVGRMTIAGMTGASRIGIYAFNWDLSVPAGSLGSGKATLTDPTVVKALDRTSPALFLAAVSGSHFSRVTIELLRTDPKTGAVAPYMTYCLGDVGISGVAPWDNGVVGDVAYEEIEFRARRLVLTHTSGATATTEGFDFVSSTSTKTC